MSLAVLRALLVKRKLPDQMILFATSRCNSRCAACFFAKSLNAGADPGLDNLGRLARSAGRLTWLDVTGGEPFLRRDLAEICRLFCAHAGVRFLGLPTNGSLPEEIRRQVPEILAASPAATVTVSVSLDGLREEHDRLRGMPGAWEKALESLATLRELRRGRRRLRVAVCTTIMASNAASAPALMDFVADELDVDLHALNVLRGEPPDPSCRPPSPEQYEAVARLWLDRLGFYCRRQFPSSPWLAALAVRMHRGLARRYIEHLRGQAPRETCVAAERCAVVYPDGTVAACELTEPLGNLAPYGWRLDRLWLDPAVAARRLSLARKPCSCTHASFQSRNVELKPGLALKALLGLEP